MKQRVITAIVLCIIAIPVCVFSGTVVFPIAMAFIGVVGVWEILGCMGTRKYKYLSIPL
jgi:CDP-diglyceride synthetase